MTETAKLKPAYFGDEVESVQNRAGRPLFKKATLVWSKPKPMEDRTRLFDDDDRPVLYAITRDHHRMKTKNTIAYIGLSIDPKNRFRNHPKADMLADRQGETKLSFSFLDLGRSSRRIETVKAALEEIEHLLIWALWQTLENERKQFTLPGMGVNGASAWHIVNEGYRFSGLMPREIVYPWMLVLPGRDRSTKL